MSAVERGDDGSHPFTGIAVTGVQPQGRQGALRSEDFLDGADQAGGQLAMGDNEDSNDIVGGLVQARTPITVSYHGCAAARGRFGAAPIARAPRPCAKPPREGAL